MTNVAWSPLREQKLRKMHADGCSSRVIAIALGPPATRNSVISKINRMGLTTKHPSHPNPKVQNGNRNKLTRVMFKGIDFRKPSTLKPASVASPMVSEKLLEPVPLHIGLDELRAFHCRWPYGESPFTFCGHPKHGQRSYCQFHSSICGQRTSR